MDEQRTVAAACANEPGRPFAVNVRVPRGCGAVEVQLVGEGVMLAAAAYCGVLLAASVVGGEPREDARRAPESPMRDIPARPKGKGKATTRRRATGRE